MEAKECAVKHGKILRFKGKLEDLSILCFLNEVGVVQPSPLSGFEISQFEIFIVYNPTV